MNFIDLLSFRINSELSSLVSVSDESKTKYNEEKEELATPVAQQLDFTISDFAVLPIFDTTQAVGEEDDGHLDTTQAVGEEDEGEPELYVEIQHGPPEYLPGTEPKQDESNIDIGDGGVEGPLDGIDTPHGLPPGPYLTLPLGEDENEGLLVEEDIIPYPSDTTQAVGEEDESSEDSIDLCDYNPDLCDDSELTPHGLPPGPYLTLPLGEDENEGLLVEEDTIPYPSDTTQAVGEEDESSEDSIDLCDYNPDLCDDSELTPHGLPPGPYDNLPIEKEPITIDPISITHAVGEEDDGEGLLVEEPYCPELTYAPTHSKALIELEESIVQEVSTSSYLDDMADIATSNIQDIDH